ncbi:hypothetical protein BDK51DRAFT_28962 [Blyttiomyces helicus]|uniref:Uncharacterized protein n=1 Tax=Blyttiomyces helicus TaxID=388810 RepID=A0A4P9WPP0_9FUNG|nr:hypothetical protein BDK51DRAFT_28962 [Blyttiomyces helicus]|eukprot:RKO94103.1 hypothetical protein BDK51DRAFT_28962 [Blyttiomyces helicus]
MSLVTSPRPQCRLCQFGSQANIQQKSETRRSPWTTPRPKKSNGWLQSPNVPVRKHGVQAGKKLEELYTSVKLWPPRLSVVLYVLRYCMGLVRLYPRKELVARFFGGGEHLQSIPKGGDEAVNQDRAGQQDGGSRSFSMGLIEMKNDAWYSSNRGNVVQRAAIAICFP